MSNKKRVFATNDILNYKDVYSLKNGTEILKTIKRDDNLAVLGQFKNYYQLQTLQNAYYPFLDNNIITVDNVQNLCQANDSFVDYSNEDCIKNVDCSPCRKPLPKNCEYKKPCEENCYKPLSFKGNILKKKQVVPYSSQSSKIYICKWNNDICIKPVNPFYNCHCTKARDKCNCACISSCCCSLCRNAKPLFI